MKGVVNEMERKMDPKKFLLYYLPVAIILLIVQRVFPQWVDDNLILYYILLLGWAMVSEQLARREPKDKK